MDGQSDMSDDWGAFGRPLFEDPSARALSRVGVIDVGSNSVRLVIFDGAARSPAYFYNEKIMCGLGAGLGETGHLNPEGRVRALSAMRRFAAVARAAQVKDITIAATAAVRDASDGAAFRKQVEEQTGLKIWVVDGREEARLSAQGVLLGWPGSYGLVCDIGGSSMELAEIEGGKVGLRETSNLGPLKLMAVRGGKKGRRRVIDQNLDRMKAALGDQRNRLFLVGGSWRAFARIDMDRRGYPLHVLHEYRMTARDVRATAEYLSTEQDHEALRQRCHISSTRMALVPYASEVLVRLVSRFKPHDIAVSSYGIREGLLYEQMPERLRDRDPLIEACRFAEAKDARLPGFGQRLYNFLRPIFPRAKAAETRLIKAACLLHDVSWRAHPDYRAEVCFDAATRANLGGLKHAERIFLGLALLHRYKNSREGSRIDDLVPMLSEVEIKRAEVLGKAMRFGAMLWAEAEDMGAELKWAPKKKLLSLKLTKGAEPLFGEVVQARFQSLAAALDAQTEVKISSRGLSHKD
ncbi:MAG: Ppx/GppA family phosphatase [Pseudomonadota bacterium]